MFGLHPSAPTRPRRRPGLRAGDHVAQGPSPWSARAVLTGGRTMTLREERKLLCVGGDLPAPDAVRP